MNSGANDLFKALRIGSERFVQGLANHAIGMFFLVLAGLCRETDAFAELLQLARTDVGRHDDNGILEIHGPS